MIRKLVKNEYVFALFTKAITIITGVFSNIFLTRYLGVELKGEYTYITTVIGLLMVLLNLGIYQTYMYQRRTNGVVVLQKYVNIFIYQFILYLFIAIISCSFVGNYQLKLAFIALPLEILNYQIMMVYLVENYNERQKTLIASQILYLLLTIALYFFLPRNIVIAIVALLIKDFLCVFYSFKGLYLWNGEHGLDFNFLNETLKGGFLMMLAALMLTLNYKVDVLMLDEFTNDKQIGLYAIGVGLAEYTWIIPDAFKEVLFGKSARGNARRDVNKSIYINLIILIPLVVVIIVFSKIIINLLYGFEFIEAKDVTRILALGVPVMVLFKIIGIVYLSEGKYLFYTISLSVCAATNIALNYYLIPKYGINGAAVASVFSYNLCGFIFLFKYIYDNRKRSRMKLENQL